MNLHEIKGPVIRTFTGKLIDVYEPDPELICIEDIAHALSMLCRWGGHVNRFYSVAEHSIECSRKVPLPEAMAALLHDASEAYLVDVPSPIKHKMSEYKAVEDNLMRVIAKKFDFEYPLSREVEEIDKRMLNIEWYALMVGSTPHQFRLFGPTRAEQEFLEEYNMIVELNICI